MDICATCRPWYKRGFCWIASGECEEKNEILARIDDELTRREDMATGLLEEMRQRRKEWLGER